MAARDRSFRRTVQLFVISALGESIVLTGATTSVRRAGCVYVSAISPSRLIGALACLAIGALGGLASGLVLAGLVVAVLVAVIVYEHARACRRRAAAGLSV